MLDFDRAQVKFLMIVQSFIKLLLQRILFIGEGRAENHSHLEIAHRYWPSLGIG